MQATRPLRVALAGNPNAGKTSLFNALTGSRQHVGNYAGVTVEKREGHYRYRGRRHRVLDLPGTYSLTSYSPEERIAQDALLQGDIDVVVVVVDATTLSRSLLFLTQLLQLRVNPVLCLNMSDEAKAAGQELDAAHLSRLLGFPVVETVGHRATGLDFLKSAILCAARAPVTEHRVDLGEPIEAALEAVESALTTAGVAARQRRWVACKLLLGDKAFFDSHRELGGAGARAADAALNQRRRLEAASHQDISVMIASAHAHVIGDLLRQVMSRPPRTNARARSDLIDTLVVNRVLGLPIFLAVMYGIFWLTFTVGEIPMGWIEEGAAHLGAAVSGLWPAGSDSNLRSLLVDGIINGVGGVMVFLPNVVLLFLGLAFLEDTGYMARAAFLMDRLMNRFGLHGRSFIPLMTGFGCSIPGIMATRTLENERDRLTTMMVLPLMSCGARLTIWMLLIPAFFPAGWRAPMLWLIYVIGVALALVLALGLRSSILRGPPTPFVMELPPYRVPTARALWRKMSERSWMYLRKAGTTILCVSILMWAAAAYPKVDRFEVDARIAKGEIEVSERVPDNASSPAALPADGAGDGTIHLTPDEVANRRAQESLRHSFAGRVGAALETVLSPLGFDWKIGTALVGAFAAKEIFVAQMGIVYSLGEADSESHSLREILQRDYPPLVGFCLMLFLLIATPCTATIILTCRESGSWKWGALQFAGLTGIAYALTCAVYQIGIRLGG